MRELRIPIDMIAGSSIGSPLAVSFALELGAEETLVDRTAEGFAGLKVYTVPVVVPGGGADR